MKPIHRLDKIRPTRKEKKKQAKIQSYPKMNIPMLIILHPNVRGQGLDERTRLNMVRLFPHNLSYPRNPLPSSPRY